MQSLTKLILTLFASNVLLAAAPAQELVFRDLFNGRDLTGWIDVNTSPDTWSVRDGMLICTGQPIGVMRSDRQYENFIIEVEWRHMEPGGNSGIFLWSDAKPEGNRLPLGMEVQMLELDWVNQHKKDDGTLPPIAYVHGELFGAGGMTAIPDNPRGTRSKSLENRCKGVGQWNKYVIVAVDGTVKLSVNGKFVNGIRNASYKKGYICLESEGKEIHFRNLRIMELPGGLADETNTAPVIEPQRAAARRPNPAMREVEDVAGLPRVLLIGDSISIGYTVPVREMLEGKANVHRPLTNCGPTIKGVAELDTWLGDGKWDVIHFNFGLHDLKYMGPNGENLADPAAKGSHQQVPPDEYAKNLTAIVERLEKTNAKLIWRNTTPVPDGANGRVVGDSKKYNAIAKQIMDAHGIPIDDQYAFAMSRLDEIQLKANVHFTPEGYQQLASQSVAAIEKALQ